MWALKSAEGCLPNHGIGTIEQIEQKQIGATALPFYTLRLAVLIPWFFSRLKRGRGGPGVRQSPRACEVLFKALADDSSLPQMIGRSFQGFLRQERSEISSKSRMCSSTYLLEPPQLFVPRTENG